MVDDQLAGEELSRRSGMYTDRHPTPRIWRSIDVKMAVGISILHFLCLFAPFTFTWPAFWVAVALFFSTGIFGITLCYHRCLSHQSFILPKWLEYTFAYFGVLAAQRDPIFWVSVHRYHHKYADSEQDAHSPNHGFWFSHIGWLFHSDHLIQKMQRDRKNVEDLRKQPFYLFVRRTYNAHLVSFALVLYVAGGFPFLVWGMGVRTVALYHLVFLTNSACHIWGTQAWNTGDHSKNNWWLSILTVGAGEMWHNNHHAFEYSAKHGLEWWQCDTTWYVIRLLQAAGLATNVKLPTHAQKQKKSFPSSKNA